MKEIVYKDFKIRYSDEGKGETLLLLHGFCESSEIWDDFRDTLSKRYRVITPDLLGHGETLPPAVRNSDGQYVNTMEMQAESAAAVLKSAGVERCTVAGHSMGGYTALAFAELFPEKVKGLCLFHSTAMADPGEKKGDRDKAIEAVMKDKKAFLEGLIPKMFAPANVEKMKSQVEKVLSIAMNIHEEGLIAALAGMRDRKDRQHVLDSASYPVLFIIGKDDILIPPDRTLPLIVKPGHAEVLLLSGVGHMGFYEAREKTLFAIGKFMEETATEKSTMREKQFFNIAISVFVLLLLLTGCAVTGEEESLITVLPGSAVVTLGDTEEFSVTPAGTAVTWSVDDILGGNEGTIDADGKYTAPSDDDTAPEKVVVRATDTSGSTASAIAYLTTFDANKRLTTYTAGTFRANTYSSGQKNIAVFIETVTGDINVYAVWSDNSSGSYKVYFTKSGNGGDSFDTPVPVDGTSPGEQFSPAIAVDDNGDVFIVWEDRGQGDADIFFRKYDSDAGFDTKKQINADTAGIFDYDTTPSIANSSGQIYITWEHRNYVIDDYPDIYFAWSSNLGDNFQTPKYLTLSGRRPAITMDSSGVAYVVWEDLGEGLTKFPSLPTVIKLRKIEDGTEGASKSLVVSSGYNARFPAIAVDPVCNTSGDLICDVYVVWQRALISEPKFVSEVISSYDIDLTIVNGGTLGIIKTTLSVPDSGSSGIFGGAAYPAVAADDSNIYMVWDDWRNGTKDIYFAKSSDGVNFTTKRIVNDDTDNSSGVTWHEKPGIAVADGKAYVIWTDYRNTQLSTTASPNDVFFAVEQ